MHFLIFSQNPMSSSLRKTAPNRWLGSSIFIPVKHAIPFMFASAVDITLSKMPSAALTPKAKRFILISLMGVFRVSSIAVSFAYTQPKVLGCVSLS